MTWQGCGKQGGWGGQTVNPISTMGTDYAHHSTTSSPDFRTLRRPCMIKKIPLHIDTNCDSIHVKTGNFFDVSRLLNLNDGSNCRGRQRRQHGIMHRQCCQCRGSEVFILLPDFALAVDGSRPWFQVHLAENSRRSTDPACSDRKGVNMQSLDYDGIKIS